MNDQEEEEVSEDELNEELKRLYNEIQKAQEKRVQLLTSIKTNKAKLNEAKQLVERLPKINEIVNMANQLPTKNIEDLGRRLQNLLEKAKEVAAKTLDEKKRIEFEKAAFQFD
ncbi:hypothetical protein TRFO_18192 [Tritrichomonas foetus]|uniref:Uncharacterized protein n=1 Tax=Tritrichomonas foetus TaxID=1144522 RepID=A0A1J4KQV5_9EUKA|nr:hypothetical protein TRFO_18192 [Tritrichomonas foetus]|eukprot:OHT12180.1 hypothetical protein TRFO_18192 [Tritrichomonas foetus]